MISASHLEEFLRHTQTEKTAVALYSLPGDSFFHLVAQRLEEAGGREQGAGFIIKPFHISTGAPEILIRADVSAIYAVESLQEIAAENAIPFSFWEGYAPLPAASVKENYLAGVKTLKKAFREGLVHKAMLAAVREVPLPGNTTLLAMLLRLKQLYPNTLVSYISTPYSGTWIGATPEVLLKSGEGYLRSMALAGTHLDLPDHDWTAKEKDEQEWVTRHIMEVFSGYGVPVMKGPYDFHTGNLVHLRTDIELYDPAITTGTALELSSRVHPTPAVGGYPKDKSIPLISATESFNRTYYAGVIGPVDESAAFLFVNLRCMRLMPGKAFIYTGAGITEGSDPESEWEETAHKAALLRHAIPA